LQPRGSGRGAARVPSPVRPVDPLALVCCDASGCARSRRVARRWRVRPLRRTLRALGANETDAVWRGYWESRDPELRERLIVAYAVLVEKLAARIAARLPPGVDEADLISFGLFGLIAAIEDYRPELGIRFEPYGSERAREAILADLRNVDWIPRLSKTQIEE